jgi:predicted methyltransferase
MIRALLAATAALTAVACTVPPAQPPAPDAADIAEPPAATPAARAAAPATGSPVAQALGAADRPADQAERDASRASLEVMTFAEIGPGDRVLDLGAYEGYSTWILSGIVGPEGAVVAQNPEVVVASFPAAASAMEALTAARPNVSHALMPFDRLAGEPGSFDVVFSGLFYHDTAYMDVDRGLMNQRIFELLKPGGRYVVIDHRAAAGSGLRDVQSLHRIDPARVRREVENAGFLLDAESDVLTRPADDLTKNVFDDAIRGQTSQFVYRFVKPAA